MANKVVKALIAVSAVIGAMLLIASGGQADGKILIVGGVGLIMMLPGAIYSGTRYYDISEIE